MESDWCRRSVSIVQGPWPGRECPAVGEVGFVEGIAAANVAACGETAVAAGIVGNADLMLGDGVAPVLEALAEAGKGRFKGIRCTAAWDASPEITTARANSAGMLANAEFRKGLACLERMGCVGSTASCPPALAGGEDRRGASRT